MQPQRQDEPEVLTAQPVCVSGNVGGVALQIGCAGESCRTVQPRQGVSSVSVISIPVTAEPSNLPSPLPGLQPEPVGFTFAQYAATCITERVTRKGRTLSPRTRELYEDQLRLHIIPHLGELDLAAITPMIVRSWFHHVRGPSGPGASTAAKCYRLLHSIMRIAVDDEIIKSNPCRIRGAGIEPESIRDIPTVTEFYELADAIDPRLRCLVLCAGFLGLRKGELLGLRRHDIDLDVLEVSVARSRGQLRNGQQLIGPVKTDQSLRIVTIPQLLVAELQTHLDNYAQDGDDGWLFTGAKGGALGPTWFYNQ